MYYSTFYATCLFFLLSLPTTFSQNPIENNAQQKGQLRGIMDLDLIDELMLIMPGFEGGTREALQEQSVKPFLMPPRQIGKRGFPLAYATANCLEYYINFEKNYKINLSPDYISLSIQTESGEMNILDAFQFLNNTGTVSAAIMPYDASAISTAVYATQKYRIDNFLHIFTSITNKRQRIFEVRKALRRGNPVIANLSVNPDFHKIENEKIWEPEKLDPEQAQIYPLLVVGYDESKEAFEVQGIWGNKWGSNGYLWIKYSDFSKYSENAYVILPEDRPQ